MNLAGFELTNSEMLNVLEEELEEKLTDSEKTLLLSSIKVR